MLVIVATIGIGLVINMILNHHNRVIAPVVPIVEHRLHTWVYGSDEKLVCSECGLKPSVGGDTNG